MTRVLGFKASACLLFVVFGASAQSTGESVTTNWRCFEPYEKSGVPLVTLARETLIGTNKGYGKVSVAGMKEQEAVFLVEGINRRWYFGNDYDYSIVVKPDGTGLYYDFSNVEDGETTTPRDRFACKPV